LGLIKRKTTMSISPLARSIRAKKLGALIKDARMVSGESEETCAKWLGVSLADFEAYERGELSPSLPELELLAYILDVPLGHFWEDVSLSQGDGAKGSFDTHQFTQLRRRIIGAKLRQARMGRGLSLEEISTNIKIDVETLSAYELGEQAVPLPVLESLGSELGLAMRDLQDQHGPVGTWNRQQHAIHEFLSLPPELQAFVGKPVNLPYLELAQRLSEMSVEKLRAVAEGLLEITL
jgi:transcriptional regulator with XRE-family HTH domain